MPDPLRLAVLSTSRSEFGQLAPIVRLAQDDPRFAVRFAVGGMHHDTHTPATAEMTGLRIDRLPRPADSLGLVHQVALRAWLADQRAECVLLLGDRFELLEAALPAVHLDLVIAHLSGGERTAGAIDDQVRNAVSQLAHLHFPAHAAAGARLQEMAVPSWRICVAGEPGLDAIRSEGLIPAAELDLPLAPRAGDVVVAVHPVTRDAAETRAIIDVLADLIAGDARRWFLSSPNGDPGSELIRERWQSLMARHPARVVALDNRGARWFRSLTAACGVQLGNSSAGLVEAPSLHAVTIDVGTRQQGRPRGPSVITVAADGIAGALTRTEAHRPFAAPEHNPYGDGHTAERVLAFLATHARDPRIRRM